MSATKVAISLDDSLLQRLDILVTAKFIGSRDELIQEAVADKIASFDKAALARECAKLNAAEEQDFADEGLQTDAASWPKY